jgi:LmbE family N-acetylglucosaminyl deacetylase
MENNIHHSEGLIGGNEPVNVLAFFAHPDDETMLAGGALALLAENGAQVHYLSATRGEGGETGEPPLCSIDELGQVREDELVCAVGVLGGRSLTFLGYTDPRMGEDEQLYPYTEDVTFLAGQVAASIRQFKIDVVISHGSNGEYGHPAHMISHQAALAAVMSFDDRTPSLYTVAANYSAYPYPRLANEADQADLVVDISPVVEKKINAALCHRTQHALFVRWTSREAGREMTVPEVVMKQESFHRAYPDGPEDPLMKLLNPWSIDFSV